MSNPYITTALDIARHFLESCAEAMTNQNDAMQQINDATRLLTAPPSNLTDLQRQLYVRSGGMGCPFCGSESVYSEESCACGVGYATAKCHCKSCGHQFTEHYALVDVKGDE